MIPFQILWDYFPLSPTGISFKIESHIILLNYIAEDVRYFDRKKSKNSFSSKNNGTVRGISLESVTKNDDCFTGSRLSNMTQFSI
jgi:hypothetical protein